MRNLVKDTKRFLDEWNGTPGKPGFMELLSKIESHLGIKDDLHRPTGERRND